MVVVVAPAAVGMVVVVPAAVGPHQYIRSPAGRSGSLQNDQTKK